MGWETLAIAGFSALQAGQTMEAGENKAKAITQQAGYTIQNQANDTVRSAGTLRNSFLSNGISLDGGPMAAIAQVFNTGNTNIARTATAANRESKDAINGARTAALSGLAKNAMAASTVPTFMSDVTSAYNWAGQEVGSIFDSSPTGPYQPWFAGA